MGSPTTLPHATLSGERLPLMEPSEEIRRVVHRWLVANRDGDVDAVMARISEHSGLLAIGTDPGEWWHGPERAVWRRQIEESGGFPLSWGEIEAWEEGTVGWAGMAMKLGVSTARGRAPRRARRTSSTWKPASGSSFRCTGRCPGWRMRSFSAWS